MTRSTGRWLMYRRRVTTARVDGEKHRNGTLSLRFAGPCGADVVDDASYEVSLRLGCSTESSASG